MSSSLNLFNFIFDSPSRVFFLSCSFEKPIFVSHSQYGMDGFTVANTRESRVEKEQQIVANITNSRFQLLLYVLIQIKRNNLKKKKTKTKIELSACNFNGLLHNYAYPFQLFVVVVAVVVTIVFFFFTSANFWCC